MDRNCGIALISGIKVMNDINFHLFDTDHSVLHDLYVRYVEIGNSKSKKGSQGNEHIGYKRR